MRIITYLIKKYSALYHHVLIKLSIIKANLFYVTRVSQRRLEKKKSHGVNLIILAYHSIKKDKVKYKGLQVKASTFESQIKFLNKHFQILPLDEALVYLNKSPNKALNKLVITFDDGYKDNFETAYPILQKHNIPATIFITANPVETQNLIWTNKLRLFIESANSNILRLSEDEILKISSNRRKRKALDYLRKKAEGNGQR